MGVFATWLLRTLTSALVLATCGLRRMITPLLHNGLQAPGLFVTQLVSDRGQAPRSRPCPLSAHPLSFEPLPLTFILSPVGVSEAIMVDAVKMIHFFRP